MSLYIPHFALLIPLFTPLYLATTLSLTSPYHMSSPIPLLFLLCLLNVYPRYLPRITPYLTTHHPLTPPTLFHLLSNWEIKLVMYLRIYTVKQSYERSPWWELLLVLILGIPYSPMKWLGDKVSTDALIGSKDGEKPPKISARAWVMMWGQTLMHIGLCVVLLVIGYGEGRSSVLGIIFGVIKPRFEDGAGVIHINRVLQQWVTDAARAVLVWIACMNLVNIVKYFIIARKAKEWDEVDLELWERMTRDSGWKRWRVAVFELTEREPVHGGGKRDEGPRQDPPPQSSEQPHSHQESEQPQSHQESGQPQSHPQAEQPHVPRLGPGQAQQEPNLPRSQSNQPPHPPGHADMGSDTSPESEQGCKPQYKRMAQKWNSRWTRFQTEQRDWEWRQWDTILRDSKLDRESWKARQENRPPKDQASSEQQLPVLDWLIRDNILRELEDKCTNREDNAWRKVVSGFKEADMEDHVVPDKVLIIRRARAELTKYGIAPQESGSEDDIGAPRSTKSFLALVLGQDSIYVGLHKSPMGAETKNIKEEIQGAEDREYLYELGLSVAAGKE